MPPIVLSEALLIAIAEAVEAVANYQRVRLEKIPEVAQAEAEWARPWLLLGQWVNEQLKIGAPK